MSFSHKGRRKKEEFLETPTEACRWLRALAAEIEAGVVAFDNVEFAVEPKTTIKISRKWKSDSAGSRLKFKVTIPLGSSLVKEAGSELEFPDRSAAFGGSVSTPADCGGMPERKERYRDLKKRMSQDFRAINAQGVEMILQDSELVERFCHDAKAMCDYPDKGQEYYKSFLVQLEQFYAAYVAADLAVMASTLAGLHQSKKECHERYK